MKNFVFTKIGRILKAEGQVPWLVSHTGASFGRCLGQDIEIFVTGRDKSNRSHIGRIIYNIRKNSVTEIDAEPVLSPGVLGAFDENGVSYPCIVKNESGDEYLYYTGWMPTVLTPFQNHVGLAIRKKGEQKFIRYSKAPILSRTDKDYLSMGSVFVLREDDQWRMYYTAFSDWGKQQGDPKHHYTIKYAYSKDGIVWEREDQICIRSENGSEDFSISRPSVLKIGTDYHMWFCYRGEDYKIGYASSTDGVNWKRDDSRAGIWLSETGWDCEGQAYPHVLVNIDQCMMLYCGNSYGKDGLGFGVFQGDKS